MTNPSTPDELKDEIARTRADLGETAAALAAKADVKTRVKESAAAKADQLKGTAAAKADLLKTRVTDEVVTTKRQLQDGDVAAVARRPVPLTTLAVVAAAAAAVVLVIRRSRR
jgi:hypothetical protein